MTVDLSVGGQSEDRLTIRNQGTGAGQIGVSGANVDVWRQHDRHLQWWDRGSTPLVIILNGNATPTAVQALVRNITYRNASDAPSMSAARCGLHSPTVTEAPAPLPAARSARHPSMPLRWRSRTARRSPRMLGRPRSRCWATTPTSTADPRPSRPRPIPPTGPWPSPAPAGAHTGLNYVPDAGYCNTGVGGSTGHLQLHIERRQLRNGVDHGHLRLPSLDVAPVIAAIEGGAVAYTENDSATVITTSSTVTGTWTPPTSPAAPRPPTTPRAARPTTAWTSATSVPAPVRSASPAPTSPTAGSRSAPSPAAPAPPRW